MDVLERRKFPLMIEALVICIRIRIIRLPLSWTFFLEVLLVFFLGACVFLEATPHMLAVIVLWTKRHCTFLSFRLHVIEPYLESLHLNAIPSFFASPLAS